MAMIVVVWLLLPTGNAKAMSDIRVGLVSQYKDKDVITIYNKRICVGYATKNSFTGNEVFYGNNGFSFEPDNGKYIVNGTKYKNYDEARKAIGQNNTKDVVPVLKGPGVWQLYERSDKDAASKREHLIRVSFGKSSFLIDAVEGDASGKYSPFPQIKAVGAKNDSEGRLISLGSRSYRGRIEIVRNGSKLTAVNVIGIEAYLCGVVTCEMDKSYDPEALKAQAVVARSYALYNSGFTCKGSLSEAYRLTDTTSSQVYRGVNGESKEAVAAVSATVGEVIYSGDEIVETFYFSTSGGSTESGIEVWGIKSPIYDSKPDLFELRPEKAPWVITYTFQEASKLLADNGFDVGNVESVKELIVTETGRVSSLKVVGSKKSVNLTIQQAQSIFDLYSAKYKVVLSEDRSEMPFTVGDNTSSQLKSSGIYAISESGTKTKIDNLDQLIVIGAENMNNYPLAPVPKGSVSFFGMGHGHGIGLSQSGANGLAAEGYDYKKIIYYYFDNIRIDKY